jgi:hypothetical protein
MIPVWQSGTYAAMKFEASVARALEKFCVDHQIPNATPIHKLHVTLLYSRKYLPNYVAAHHDNTIMATPREFVVWQTNVAENLKCNCLILRLNSPELIARHNKLMKEHDAWYDYPTFEPHTTLSYDIGDMDITKFDISELPDLMPLVMEYQKELTKDWDSRL